MNNNKLKGILVEKGKTYSDCSKVLGLTITGFSNKINGHSNFYIHEANKLSEYLQLTEDEKVAIFLP